MSADSSSSRSHDESPPPEPQATSPKKRCEEDPLNLLKGISFMFVNYAKNQPIEQSIDFSPRKKSNILPS